MLAEPDGPGPGEDHSLTAHMAARAELAAAYARAGDLEAAMTTAGPVLALPPALRSATLPPRLALIRAAVADPRYDGTARAREFSEELERWTAP